ncbi:MAG TPA: hypothetical protein VK390_17375 [Propionibacteriaceae bacterium]|nr:hypothetical protein [Propionibacteriaceae bacterium]
MTVKHARANRPAPAPASRPRPHDARTTKYHRRRCSRIPHDGNPNHPTPRLGKIVENALAAGIDYAATAPIETSLLNPPSPAAQAHPVIGAEIIGSVERQSARQAEVPGGSARGNGRIVLTLVGNANPAGRNRIAHIDVGEVLAVAEALPKR